MKKIVLILTFILAGISVMSQNGADLRLNLEKNKVYRFNSLSEQQIAQTVQGNQQTTDSRTNYSISLKMVDATPDFMITEVHFDTLNTHANTMGKITMISSAKEGDMKSSDATDIMTCIMNRLSKNPLYVKMDYSGKVMEIVNLKMFSEIVLKDTSSITLSGPVAAAVKTQIVNLVSDKTLANMVEMYTYNLPGKQVATGGSWNVTHKMYSGGMILDIVNDYHLDGINGNQAKVSAESNIKAAENAPPIESAGAKVTYDNLTGLSKSNMVIDVNTGLLIESRAKTRISGNLGVSVGAMSMTIPMDISGESKITVVQ